MFPDSSSELSAWNAPYNILRIMLNTPMHINATPSCILDTQYLYINMQYNLN